MTKTEDKHPTTIEQEKMIKDKGKTNKEISERRGDEQKVDELTQTLQRLQAEFENYRKRTEKECTDFMRYSNAKLINKLLPILDSFELALKNTKEPEQFKKGMELIYSQLYQTLEEQGVRKIEALNKKFDPYRHEVLLTEESDKEEDTILEELQKGYMLNDQVLRHTKVKIAKRVEKK